MTDEVNQAAPSTGVQIDNGQLVSWYRKELDAANYRASQAEAGLETLLAQRHSLFLRVEQLEREKAETALELSDIRAQVEELRNGGLEDAAAEDDSDEEDSKI
jgi:hypothetical protein